MFRRLSCPESNVAGKANTVLLRNAHRANPIATAYKTTAGSVCPRTSSHCPPVAPTIATMPKKTLARTVRAGPKAAKCSGGTGTAVAAAPLPAAASSKPTGLEGLDARNCITSRQRAEIRKPKGACLIRPSKSGQLNLAGSCVPPALPWLLSPLGSVPPRTGSPASENPQSWQKSCPMPHSAPHCGQGASSGSRSPQCSQ